MLGQDYCLNSGQEHRLNEELDRHRGREGCLLCDAECESVSHVLWDCPAYASIRSAFMLELLGDRFEHFQSLDSFEKSSYVLGSEAWEEYSSGLLSLRSTTNGWGKEAWFGCDFAKYSSQPLDY